MEDIRKLFELAENKGLKVSFGLEAQGHIPTIESELKRWNDGFRKDYPEEKDHDMIYCKDVWYEIGKKIGWCPFTAALSYFEYLSKSGKNICETL